MRLPEIAEPPGRGRDNGEGAVASEQAEHVRIDVAKNVADARALAEIGERDDGQGDERYHHDRALDEIGQADCKEAAEHDIGAYDRGRDPPPALLGKAERGLEHNPARAEPPGP